jgi:sulfonate transport system ATP-binding protein
LVTHDVTEAIVLGDRVALIEDGIVKLELNVDLPRPRRRGTPEVAALENKILRYLFNDAGYLGWRNAA